MNDHDYMREAYTEALKAYDNGEYPVGAIVVRNGEILSQAANAENSDYDPTAHAEIRAIRQACKKLKTLKLEDCTLYTTLSPCPMCESTIIEVGIKKVVYGGESFKPIRDIKYSNKDLQRIGPILNDDCRGIFAKRLKEKGRYDILNNESSYSSVQAGAAISAVPSTDPLGDIEKPRNNQSLWLLTLVLAVCWALPVIGLILPAGRQESLWRLLVIATALIAVGVLGYCVIICLRKQWRLAELVMLYVVGCGLTVPAAIMVSSYKGGIAELQLAAQRYEDLVYGMDRQSVAALFKGSRISPAEFGTRDPEKLVDSVDNFTGGFGDIIIVYYREERVVGKCLYFWSEPRPSFPPVHPSSPLEGQICY